MKMWFRGFGAGLLVLAAGGCVYDRLAELEHEVRARIAKSPAHVGFYFRDLETGDSVTLSAARRMHAASLMKVPVMIQVFRDAEAGRLTLDAEVPITNTFRSLVDGSPYSLSPATDGDTTLYARVGGSATLRELMELMITLSSNLATNLLVELVDPERVTRTMRALGADSIEVVRGVQDLRAHEAGLNNTATARDLGVIFGAIAEGRAASRAACDLMLAILERERFRERIPAGLPPGVRVAHKTGDITDVHHDAGVVTLRDGRRYVLVVLTEGFRDPEAADRFIAGLSRVTYRHMGERRPRAT